MKIPHNEIQQSIKNENSDAFFKNFLSYRNPIVSKEFVEQTFKRIERQQNLRFFIIAFCCLAGILSLASTDSLAWLSFPKLNHSFLSLASLGLEAATGLVVASMILLSVWLVTSE